jgi:ABC-2 type transport system permease protein
VSFLFIAIGIVTSASSGTPLVAAFFAMVVNVIFVAAPLSGAPQAGPLGDVLAWVLEKVDVISHFQGSFLTGAIDTAHVTFFIAWIAALLFLAVRIVESRRWLG